MKAGARVCGLDGIQEVAHRLETLFAQIRERKVELEWPAPGGHQLRAGCHRRLPWLRSTAGNRPRRPAAQALSAIDRILSGGTTAAPKKDRTRSAPFRQRVLAAFQSEQQEHLAGIRAILAKAQRRDNGVLSEIDLQ